MVESPGGRSAADLVHQVADLLAVLCADPVYKVFYGAIVSTSRQRDDGRRFKGALHRTERY